MIVIRPVSLNDLDRLFQLAQKVAPGMTTFPPDRAVLLNKIHASNSAFSMNVSKEDENAYLMVLENTETKEIMGTAGVYSNIGKESPFYTFQILSRYKHSFETNNKVPSKTLHVVNEFTGDTEIGTLILDPDYRGHGYGKLIAKCRYMLIAQFSELFGSRLIAELRGWSDEKAISPFWESVGKHFFGGMSYDHADYLCATTNNQFIADLMPEYPIYIDLLPQDAKAVIGKPHNQGKPALQMLLNEGFRYENFVDIFDAGPTVHAYIENVDTIKNSKIVTVAEFTESEEASTHCLVCNTAIDNFKVTYIPVHILLNGTVAISAKAAEVLSVNLQDNIRIYPLSH
ncbi:arginine N-succinyltransferase [Pseudocolwellia agarivorans]|uniref:arginine N-succinyltransferase n=1 Tax=Pseudocolwellia agarivorans TaxID=1911682 RepID=UPI00098671A5|nr:arginine N-succinyltransferase [Pseudocolwellia agarivorans]